MRNVMVISAAMVAVVLCGGVAADNVFDHRENVNILNTNNPDMKITPRYGTMPASNFRIYSESMSYDYRDTNITNWLDFNFGETRNVKTIRIMNWAGYQATGFEVWVSYDGGQNYTQLAAPSYENVAIYGKVTGTIKLDTAVDTQFLRIVPTGYNNGPGGNELGRWLVQDIRVFGEAIPGGFTPVNNNIDLVSSTGLAGATSDKPAVKLTPIGALSVGDGNVKSGWECFVDDALENLTRKVMWNFNEAGKGFLLEFTNGQLYEFTTFGLAGGGGGVNNAWATFKLEVFNPLAVTAKFDGWTTVLNGATDNAYLPVTFGYFELPPNTYGTAVRLTMVNPASGNNYIEDIQLFGRPIPEPATMSLLALGGLALLRRRRG